MSLRHIFGARGIISFQTSLIFCRAPELRDRCREHLYEAQSGWAWWPEVFHVPEEPRCWGRKISGHAMLSHLQLGMFKTDVSAKNSGFPLALLPNYIEVLGLSLKADEKNRAC